MKSFEQLDSLPGMGDFAAPQVTADDHVRGPADAPVTILEYGDYECPYCRGAFRDVHLLLDRYPDNVRFVFRNFPIPQIHPHAEQAAEAAEAAAAQGEFWQMYERCCSPTRTWTPTRWWATRRRSAWTSTGFRADLASRAYSARINRDVQEGVRNGVNATPKFYVNGQRIDGKVPLEGVEDAVRAAVAAAASGPLRRLPPPEGARCSRPGAPGVKSCAPR